MTEKVFQSVRANLYNLIQVQ